MRSLNRYTPGQDAKILETAAIVQLEPDVAGEAFGGEHRRLDSVLPQIRLPDVCAKFAGYQIVL